MRREVMWAPRHGAGLEHLRLALIEEGIAVNSLTIGLDEQGRAFRLGYEMRCDGAWRVRELRVTVLNEDTAGLHLLSDGQGHWTTADGRPVPAIAGCIDVDIAATPFTNTLPIRRQGLQSGTSQELSVAYIDVPSMAVKAVRQRYTCLERGADGGRYRYESLPYEILPEGFTDELLVDADGLVIDYPKLFQRIWSG